MSAADKRLKAKPKKAENQKRVCQKFMTHPLFYFIKVFLHRFVFIGLRGVIGTFLLFGLLTDFRRYLAAGQRLAPKRSCYCFVTQISQMTQIFLRGSFMSHRFHRFSQIFYGISGESLCPISGGICINRTGRIRENP